jgi:hypothetical protein
MPTKARTNPTRSAAAAALATCLFANSAFAADLPASAAPAAPAASAPSATWLINVADGTLKTALRRWADSAGWQLVWELQADYPITTYAEVPGDFEAAVGTVARSLEHADVPMKAVFYRGNKVLRIVSRGAE